MTHNLSEVLLWITIALLESNKHNTKIMETGQKEMEGQEKVDLLSNASTFYGCIFKDSH